MIKYIRLKKGFTQCELAKRVGTTQSTISKLEKKENCKYDVHQLYLPLSKALNICPFILGIWLTNIRLGCAIDRENILLLEKNCNICPYIDCSVREL